VSFQTAARFGPRDDDKREDVYVRNVDQGGITQLGSVAGRNREVRASVLNGDLSADGSVVTFGNANNLWARNLVTRKTVRFWHEPDAPPCQPNPIGSAGRPAISADGRFAAFASCATDLPGEDGASTDVYRINLATEKIVRVHPEGNGNSFLPSLSGDGRYVGFGSEASNFAEDDTASPDAFVVDIKTGALTRASETPEGAEGNGPSAGNDVAISGDGQTLVYVSYADDLVEGDEFDLQEVFAWRADAPDPPS
jgi:Tol biopolymer transport system component